MSNKPEKYLPGRPCRDCEQTEPHVVGGVLMEPNGNSTIRQIVENVMMSLGVTFYFPPKAKRSELKTGAKKK